MRCSAVSMYPLKGLKHKSRLADCVQNELFISYKRLFTTSPGTGKTGRSCSSWFGTIPGVGGGMPLLVW